MRTYEGKYGYLRANTNIFRYFPWGQITNTDFYLLLDMQKRTYCNKTCDNKRLLQYIFHIIIFLSHILHWPFPSIDFYIAKKIFELTNCENKALRELTLFNLQIFLFRVWFKKYTKQCRSVCTLMMTLATVCKIYPRRWHLNGNSYSTRRIHLS